MGQKINTKLTNIYQFFINMLFMLSFLTPFFIDRGYSIVQIMTMQSVYMICIAVFEIPSGAFSDIFGSATTIKASALFLLLSWGSLYLVNSILGLIMYQVFFALYISFQSGSYQSYIYDGLKSIGKVTGFKLFIAKQESIKYLAMFISGVGGWGLYKLFGYSGPLVLTLVCSGVAFTITLFFPSIDHKPEKKQIKAIFDVISNGATNMFSNANLVYVVIESMLFSILINAFYCFGQISLKNNGFPVSLNGVFVSSIFFLAMLVLRYYSKIEGLFKNEVIYITTINSLLILVFSILIFAKQHWIMAFLWLVAFLLRYLKTPCISSIINSNLQSDSRATSLSFLSLSKSIIGALFAPLFGQLYHLPYGYLYISLLSIAILILCIVFIHFHNDVAIVVKPE